MGVERCGVHGIGLVDSITMISVSVHTDLLIYHYVCDWVQLGSRWRGWEQSQPGFQSTTHLLIGGVIKLQLPHVADFLHSTQCSKVIHIYVYHIYYRY